jgi:microcystin-dependent protein
MARLISSGWKVGDVRIWTNPIIDIPQGWQLCDGTNGTPNMIDRALVGAGGVYSHGQLFGADSRTPSVSVNNTTLATGHLPSHKHNLTATRSDGYTYYGANRIYTTSNGGPLNSSNGMVSSGVAATGSNVAHNHGASASAVDTRQKSVAVHWIMKVS